MKIKAMTEITAKIAVHRNEGGVESALAKNASKEIRQAEGSDPTIGGRTAAEILRNEDIPGESENSAEKGKTTNGKNRAKHRGVVASRN